MTKQSKITQEQIIKATARVIDRNGLENATIDDVAQEAGVAKGSIYVYFKSKEELLNDAVKFVAEDKIALLKDLLNRFETPLEKITAMLMANKQYAKTQPESLLMNYALLLSSHENIRTKSTQEYFKKYREYLTQMIAAAMEKGEIQKNDPTLIALILILVPDLLNILATSDASIKSDANYITNLLNLLKLTK